VNGPDATLTDDAFLGGRLQILQPRRGFRAAIDSVVLAAAVPAQAQGKVLELGTGVGTSSLCLAMRVEEVVIAGVEIEPDIAALAKANAVRNHLSDRMTIMIGDSADVPAAIRNQQFDHVFFNPPFHQKGSGTSSENRTKDGAQRANPGALADWLDTALKRLRPGGTVTLIHKPDALSEIVAGLSERAGAMAIFPLWPRPGQSAVRIVCAATKGAKAPTRLLPGLVLHGAQGGYTPEAENILRHMHSLDLGE
jgi:tRNA1(Val) A37 N6-methylase TrmN6